MASSSSRTKVFISYSHKDDRYLKRLQVHVADYERNKLVEIWDDTHITPGATWRDEIEKAIDSAKVAVLLVSADFLASNFIAESELPRLLVAAEKKGTIILPVVLSPCGFEYTQLSNFQSVNSLSKPLSKMNYHQREDIWARVAKLIRDATVVHESESSEAHYQPSSPSLKGKTEEVLPTGIEADPPSNTTDVKVSLPATTYTREMGTTSPGYFIFLLDQSASMSSPFGTAKDGVIKRKCDVATDMLNSFLSELITSNVVSEPDGVAEVRPRAEVSVLGYGDDEVRSLLHGALANKAAVTLPELQANPIDVYRGTIKEVDDTGKEFTIDVLVLYPTIWFGARTSGYGPMDIAFQQARELAKQWIANHPSSYPPVVINITSGTAHADDPTKEAQRLCQLNTTDGQTLLYNVQLSDLDFPPVLYPSSEVELPNVQFTKQLFSLSSTVPESNRHELERLTNISILPNARCFIFNGSFESLRLMFRFYDRIYRTERLAADQAMLLSQVRLKVQDIDIIEGKVETFTLQTFAGTMQRPWGIQGGSAIVYKFRTLSGRLRALRCFSIDINIDMQFRYKCISSYFAANIPHFTVDFKYHENGLAIKDASQGHLQARIHPLIEMDWIEGMTLLEYVDDLCQKRDYLGLMNLHKQWIDLAQAMHQARIAHGNLSGTNIMVRHDGKLVLIDYDTVYIPSFVGLPQFLFGQVDYQHPQMIRRRFNEQMDNFSILVIQTALLALQFQPEIWNYYTYHNAQGKLIDEKFLFNQQDFLNPDQSDLITSLEQMNDTRVRVAVRALKQACRYPIDQVAFQLF